MAKTRFLAMILFIAALMLLLAACSSSGEQIQNDNQSNASSVSSISEAAEKLIPLEDEQGSNECPYECCTEEDEYDEKPCEFDRPCVEHRCVFERCPYECCSGYEKYSRKRCKEGYNCEDNKCIPIDDDNDKLLNMEEEKLGTNPNNPDTDGDGLTDYEEVKRTKTDPKNPNTDGDRYNDKEDPNPMVAVYPSVSMELKEGFQKINEENLQALHDAYIQSCEGRVCSVDDLLPVTGDLELARISFKVVRENTGDDYTNYTDYNVYIYTISGNREERVYPVIKDRMGFLDIDQKDEKEYELAIKLSDIKVGGEGVLASVALEQKLILLPELGRVKTEGAKEE
ncbi:hypothetical protein D6764_02250 [Candidatus Woesearchaeota archaeon]|nr:MAG: hypothetical protein D6764_02250 [Candidatus Woesearchaeota archaeon]